MPLNRRDLLALLSSTTVLCSAGSFAVGTAAGGSVARPALRFPQGVASGDPTSDSVVLWSRALPPQGVTRAAAWLEVAADRAFTRPLLRQPLVAETEHDFTLRARVQQLEADTTYYYRFAGAQGSYSRLGRTRTAPAPGTERDVRLAFTSCQNYEQGFYAAWAHLVAADEAAPPDQQLDFVLQLGDFIYERSWDQRQDGSPPARRLPDFPDGVRGAGYRYAQSLADYRHLYRCYLGDPWLQAARARWPFVHTWDDHEFSDNSVQSYSSYGATLRLEAERKRDANRAWVEYIPCALDGRTQQPSHGPRPVVLRGEPEADNASARDSLRIYRTLRWGDRLELALTDNRSYRSAPRVSDALAERLGLPMVSRELMAIADSGAAYADGHPPASLPGADGKLPNPWKDLPPGTCLGARQRNWLLDQLTGSSATWKLWGNPLPLLPLYLDLSSIPFAGYQDSVFNTDAWLGYPHEASQILRALAASGATGLVSFSGDHHMHGAGLVHTDPADGETVPVIADFSCAGISSSPLFDSVLAAARESHSGFLDLVRHERDGGLIPNWNLTLTGGVLAAFAYDRTGSERLANWLGPNPANPGLSFVDSTANGYGLARFAADTMEVALVAVDPTHQPGSGQAPETRYRAHFTLPLWQAGGKPGLQGPRIAGAAPFPFSSASG